jgi:hypothetical protein
MSRSSWPRTRFVRKQEPVLAQIRLTPNAAPSMTTERPRALLSATARISGPLPDSPP